MDRDSLNIKATQITFCKGMMVDGYRMPDGNYRVSVDTASEAVGLPQKWLAENISQNTDIFKTLQKLGFGQNILEIESGTDKTQLITLSDFNTLILYAAFKGSKKAIAFNKALMATALQDFFRAHF